MTGYYRCTAANEHVGAGPIKFRFMLGQDVTTDYNATRNTHYKLTLKFKGYGNDADWHIEYEEPSDIYVSTPQYISYLYNKSMNVTLKVVGEIKPNSTLDAKILGKDEDTGFTGWRPWEMEQVHFRQFLMTFIIQGGFITTVHGTAFCH